MAIYTIQATFGRGELTPKLRSRADLDHFKMGLAACENFTVMRQGGLRRRPGTQFIAEVKDSSKAVRLIPFIFSAKQAYVLELGDHYFRVFANGGRVASVEVATPWAAADLFDLDYDQTNDVLDVTHRSYQPQRISRLSNTVWTVGPVQTKDGPYLPLNATPTTLVPSATGNAIPVMTGATAPSGTVLRSSATSGGYDGWNAMDGDPSTFWESSLSSGWLEYDFPSSKVIIGYTVQSSNWNGSSTSTGSLNAPRTWTFEGWNGSSWIILDSQFGQGTWSFSETRSFTFTNTTAYTKYRINVSQSNLGDHLNIATFGMLEDPSSAPAIMLSASSVTGINGNAGFTSSDIGRYVSLLGSDARYHPFKITAITSTTVASIKATGILMPTAQGSQQWRLGAWGATPGWPAHVATFEGRKVYARTDAQPNGIWMTKSGGYGTALDFSTAVPLADDDSITFTLADVNEIQWIAEGPDLLIGTAGAARILGRDSANLPFSANNFRQSLASTYASQAIRPAKVGSSTIFAATFGKAMREFARSENGVDYDTPDISILSEHLFSSGIVELAYAQEPDSVIWLPTGKGELIGLTYEKAQSMAGMHRHAFGGNGIVESCCAIPGSDRNEVWLVVRRTINGTSRRYIERMAAPFEGAGTSPDKAWHVDCGLQYAGAPATAVSGLAHLEGQTVSILADGARETDQVVTAGSVSLLSGKAASIILVGLPYRSRARTLPSPLSVGDGTGLGRRKKVVNARIDLFETGSLQVGRDSTSAEEIDFRRTSDALGSAPPLANGFYDARFASSWSDKGEIEMIASGPLPATVLSLILALEVEP